MAGMMVAVGMMGGLSLVFTHLTKQVYMAKQEAESTYDQFQLRSEISFLVSNKSHCTVSLAGDDPANPVTFKKSEVDEPTEGLDIKLFTSERGGNTRNGDAKFYPGKKFGKWTIESLKLQLDTSTEPYIPNQENRDLGNIAVTLKRKTINQKEKRKTLKFPVQVKVSAGGGVDPESTLIDCAAEGSSGLSKISETDTGIAVKNTLQIGVSPAFTCGNTTRGTIRFNPSPSAKLEYCDGSHWLNMDASALSGSTEGVEVDGSLKIGTTTETCSPSNKGTIRYNETDNDMEYCNATAWTKWGGSSAQSPTIPTTPTNPTTPNLIGSSDVKKIIIRGYTITYTGRYAGEVFCWLFVDGKVICPGLLKNPLNRRGVTFSDVISSPFGSEKLVKDIDLHVFAHGGYGIHRLTIYFFLCAVFNDGSVGCLGSNPYRSNPVTTLPSGRKAKAISLTDGSLCTILDDDSVACNSRILLPPGTAKRFEERSGVICVIRHDDSVTCLTSRRFVDEPLIVMEPGDTVKKQARDCAILDDASVKCRESVTGGFYQIDLGPGRTAQEISYIRANLYCAILDDGNIRCWKIDYQSHQVKDLRTYNIGSGKMAKRLVLFKTYHYGNSGGLRFYTHSFIVVVLSDDTVLMFNPSSTP